jgi:predicted Zn-dependent protease
MNGIQEHQRALIAAQGYCELGMYADALEELNELPQHIQGHPMVMEVRLIVLMQGRKWEEALKTGLKLTSAAPDKNIGYIHTAYCLHELGRTEEARELLLSGPKTLHKEPVFHYNLACYECVLGNLDLARVHLDRSVALDKKYREYAETDPDLEGIRK